MPTPRDLREVGEANAESSASEVLPNAGPRLLNTADARLPRVQSCVSSIVSAREKERDEETPGSSKAPSRQLSRQASNTNSRGDSGDLAQETDVTGAVKKKPSLLRAMTANSWKSDVTMHTAGTSSPSTPPPSVVAAKKNFKRQESKFSLGSFKTTSSLGTSNFLSEGTGSTKSTRHPGTAKRVAEEVAHGLTDSERKIAFESEAIHVVPTCLNEIKRGLPNKLSTARFNMLTWLPISLYYQFKRVANVYFLFIAVLVMFPWSPKNWKSKVFPFCIVLLWTALKDLHEDSRRRRDDKIENCQMVKVYDSASKAFVEVEWQYVRVGDVVLTQGDQAFPADMVLLYVSAADEAFISTITLDGETNLKERRPPSICDGFKPPSETAAQEGVKFGSIFNVNLEAEANNEVASMHSSAYTVLNQMQALRLFFKIGKPEVAVHDVRGTVGTVTKRSGPIGFNNFLPRGCVLRNTKWVLGLAAYVGDDTKTRMNTAVSAGKRSNMQKHLNVCVWGLLVGLVILCVYSATRAVTEERKPLKNWRPKEEDTNWGIMFLKFMITYYHVVPMSLYVCFEMLKLVLGYQVNKDAQMIDPDTKEPAVARTADLIEEMGQINFVFSDKTGTLTKNEMLFARASVHGHDFGDFRQTKASEKKEPPGITKVRNGLKQTEHDFWQDVGWFFTCVATCHSVRVSAVETKRQNSKISKSGTTTPTRQPSEAEQRNNVRYASMSPDEVALVEGASSVGFSFVERQRRQGEEAGSSDVKIKLSDGTEKIFSILLEIEFSSDRKRMSVVMQCEDGLFLVTKGADNIMELLLDESYDDATQKCLKKYSQEGLRTLVYAYRKLNADNFHSWRKQHKKALNMLEDGKEEKVSQLAALIEKNMKIIGITAVEDSLQDGVPQAIATIKEAGVRVWVLTGDKTETAVNIARSCNLFAEGTSVAYATGAANTDEALSKLEVAKEELEGVEDSGLVLDGATVQWALVNRQCRQLIYELGLASRSCVCCRLTPLQKRKLVEVVCENDRSSITLAIGDGANDVPMIEGAHLGIAVRGKEGAQAVQVSDVAISQFRFLVPLLLCHGRRAYRRVALFLCYYLYKNVVLLMGDVVWMHMDEFRGRIAFPEYLSINYNVFFTSWHILFVLGFDRDVSDEVANANPHLYLVGAQRTLFNKMVFTRWVIFALYHGLVSWLVPAYLVIDGAEYVKTEPGRFWEGSITAFTIVLFTVMLKLLLSCYSPFKLKSSIAPTLLALLCYVVILFCLGYVPPGPSMQECMKGLPTDLFKNMTALILMVATPIAVITIDICFEAFFVALWPTPLDQIRKEIRRGEYRKPVDIHAGA